MKKRDLTKKVLCTVLAASVFGVFSNGVVEAADDYIVGSDKTITGEELTGQNVIVPGEFQKSGYDLTVTGAYTIGKLDISGESAVNFNVVGNINGGIYMHSGDELSLIANNANVEGYVKITGGVAYFNGGSIVSGKPYKIGEGKYLQEDIRVTDQSGLIAKNVDITGDVMAEDLDSFVEINGGSVTEVEYYDVEGDHTENRHLAVGSDGKFVKDGYTEVHAEKGGKVTINDAVLNTGVSAFGEGSVVTVNNSSITTKGSIFAYEGGKIYLNGDANTVYSLGGEDVFMALTGSEDGESGDGLIEINGGTLKAKNLRYLVGENNPLIAVAINEGDKVVEGGIVLQNNGVIETEAGQIFANSIDGTSDTNVLASDNSGDVTNTAIKYVGGTLKLTDAKYSLDYVKSAKTALGRLGYDSATKVAMTGDLITNEGTNIINVADVASVGDNVEFDKVTVKANNLLVGSDKASGNIDDVKVKDKVANGFSAGQLNLTAGSDGMVITNAKNVTLGGSAGGELITVGGKAGNVNVVVGTTTYVPDAGVKTGSFTVGNSLATSDTVYNLSGSVTVNEGSALNVNGKTTVTEGVTLNSGAVNVGNGTLVSDITAKGVASTITGAAQIGTLTSAVGTVINIGNNDKAGNVTVKTADLQGATVFLDPTWVDGAEITDASKMAVAGTNGKVTLNGKYVVGENSVMSFGVDKNEKAQETFAKTGLTWGKDAITAGLYINGSVDLNGQAIVVDGYLKKADDAETKAGTFTAAKNSVVMVDGTTITGTNDAAVIGATKVEVADSSKLYIDGAENGETYHVIAGVDTDGWANAKIISDTALLVFNGDGNTGDKKFDVTAKYQSVNNVYGDNAVVIDSIVDKTLKVLLNLIN